MNTTREELEKALAGEPRAHGLKKELDEILSNGQLMKSMEEACESERGKRAFVQERIAQEVTAVLCSRYGAAAETGGLAGALKMIAGDLGISMASEEDLRERVEALESRLRNTTTYEGGGKR